MKDRWQSAGWWKWIVVAFIALAVIGGAAGGSEEDTKDKTAATTSGPAATPTTNAPAATTTASTAAPATTTAAATAAKPSPKPLPKPATQGQLTQSEVDDLLHSYSGFERAVDTATDKLKKTCRLMTMSNDFVAASKCAKSTLPALKSKWISAVRDVQRAEKLAGGTCRSQIAGLVNDLTDFYYGTRQRIAVVRDADSEAAADAAMRNYTNSYAAFTSRSQATYRACSPA